MNEYKLKGIQKEIWIKKYKADTDLCIEDTWRRVAKWAASAEEPLLRAEWEEKFYSILYDFVFIPGGRITEAAGTKNSYANNCFVLDIEDNLEEIFETVKRTAMISKKNGGTGICFDKIRPANAPLSGGGVGSGVVSFMRVFDVSCDVIKTGSKNRRAALMGILGVQHPEIFEFIDAKRQQGVLTNFNISVSITDDFIEAVKNDADWDLVFGGVVYRTVKAKDLWNKLCYSGWMFNDPGIFFKDTTNKYNNLYYIMDFSCTNPCGELPLFPWGACCLGNVNMTKFIINPFSDNPEFDLGKYYGVLAIATRFLDNILDVTQYPYEQNKEIALRDRRIGLNPFAGLGDTLAMMKLPYDSSKARQFAKQIAKQACETVYLASIDLAKEKGVFPSFDKEKYLNSNFIFNRFGENSKVLYGLENVGPRNSAALTLPPVGTGSILAYNISSGMEPIFAREYWRDFLQPDGTKDKELMEDYAWGLWKKLNPNSYVQEDLNSTDKKWNVPDYFKTSMEIDPKDHILMQATLQTYVDGSISKTANLPAEYTLEDYKELLMFAWDNGLKGFTTFRDGTREGVLSTTNDKAKETPVRETSIKPKRPRKLKGETYQIPEHDGNNTYCTINQNEGKPWEIFFNSSGQNYEWFAAIGRLASRIMRKTGDIDSVIGELKQIKGEGFFTQDYGFVESRPQLVGLMLEEYYKGLTGEIKTESIIGQCEICGGNLVKRGGCVQCEAGCVESYKCG
jgi:ribonucleoside-diphosphate reductase alpha chain